MVETHLPSTLLPCPFCNGDAELVHMKSGDDYMRCVDCPDYCTYFGRKVIHE